MARYGKHRDDREPRRSLRLTRVAATLIVALLATVGMAVLTGDRQGSAQALSFTQYRPAFPYPTWTRSYPRRPPSPSVTTPAPTTPTATTPVPTTPVPTATTSPIHSAREQEVLDLVNVERAKVGCGALTANATLAQVARAHSQDMAEHSYFSHTGLDGSTPFTRMTAAGYRYSTAAENIAAGYATPQSVMTAWMGSSGHRASILNCSLTELGVGYHQLSGSPYGTYWTQDFGTPR